MFGHLGLGRTRVGHPNKPRSGSGGNGAGGWGWGGGALVDDDEDFPSLSMGGGGSRGVSRGVGGNSGALAETRAARDFPALPSSAPTLQGPSAPQPSVSAASAYAAVAIAPAPPPPPPPPLLPPPVVYYAPPPPTVSTGPLEEVLRELEQVPDPEAWPRGAAVQPARYAVSGGGSIDGSSIGGSIGGGGGGAPPSNLGYLWRAVNGGGGRGGEGAGVAAAPVNGVGRGRGSGKGELFLGGPLPTGVPAAGRGTPRSAPGAGGGGGGLARTPAGGRPNLQQRDNRDFTGGKGSGAGKGSGGGLSAYYPGLPRPMNKTEAAEDAVLEAAIGAFASGPGVELRLASTLSARCRKVAHAIAERHGLLHQSSGTGASRSLLLAKDAAKASQALAASEARLARRAAQASEGAWVAAGGVERAPRRPQHPVAKWLGVDIKRFSVKQLGTILCECLSVTEGGLEALAGMQGREDRLRVIEALREDLIRDRSQGLLDVQPQTAAQTADRPSSSAAPVNVYPVERVASMYQNEHGVPDCERPGEPFDGRYLAPPPQCAGTSSPSPPPPLPAVTEHSGESFSDEGSECTVGFVTIDYDVGEPEDSEFSYSVTRDEELAEVVCSSNDEDFESSEPSCEEESAVLERGRLQQQEADDAAFAAMLQAEEEQLAAARVAERACDEARQLRERLRVIDDTPAGGRTGDEPSSRAEEPGCEQPATLAALLSAAGVPAGSGVLEALVCEDMDLEALEVGFIFEGVLRSITLSLQPTTNYYFD